MVCGCSLAGIVGYNPTGSMDSFFIRFLYQWISFGIAHFYHFLITTRVKFETSCHLIQLSAKCVLVLLKIFIDIVLETLMKFTVVWDVMVRNLEENVISLE